LLKKRRQFTRVDGLLLLLLTTGALYLAYRIKIGLNYRWNWAAIPQFLYRYDEQSGRWVANLLVQGLYTTIRLSFWSTGLATVIGVLTGLCRTSQSLFYRLLGRFYVEFNRNMPPLVLIIIFYYFVSDQVLPLLGFNNFFLYRFAATERFATVLFGPPVLFPAFVSAVISLALFEAAYIAEIVRAGVQSIEKGQWEAGHALGLSKWQQLRHVILPQALPRVLPPLAGQFVSVIKDSSIVSVISIQELTFQGLELMASTYLTFEIWITITLLYLVLTLSSSLLVRRLELRMARRAL